MILLIFLYSFLMVCSGEVYDPLSRCVPEGTYVCGDCYNQMSCVDVLDKPRGTLYACPAGTFCDMGFDGEDGNCLGYSKPSISPVCLCEKEGCFVDPNNEASHIECTATSRTVVTPCGEGELFDGLACDCGAIECPSCEFLPAGNVVVDVDECSIEEFYYCGEDEVGSAFKCNVADDMCFDERTCRCEKKPGVVDFPKCLLENCGFILYEGDANGAGYVNCTDFSINYCPTTQTYNETVCLCQGGFDCPVPAKPDTANCTDAPCPFISDPANPTGGFINCADETFSACPSDQLFNDTTCLCYSEAETEVPVVCPPDNCGYIPDPDNTGTGWYINCTDSSISVCPLGQNFNESVCLCMGGTECPGPVTENVPECSDTTINTCGFVKAPDTEGMGFVDCSDFSVSKCPTDQLFNATTCQCYSLNATCSSGGETCFDHCDFYPEAGENACPGYRECDDKGYPGDVVVYCPDLYPCFDIESCTCVGEGAEEGGPVVSLKKN